MSFGKNCFQRGSKSAAPVSETQALRHLIVNSRPLVLRHLRASMPMPAPWCCSCRKAGQQGSWAASGSLCAGAGETGQAVRLCPPPLAPQSHPIPTASQENWQKLNSAEALSTGWASSGSELAKAFGELDTEGTGSLGVKDLALAIKAAQPGIEDDKVAAMVALIDEDGDGSVRPP